MSCAPCLRAKQINACAENLILGSGTADTAYDVYIKHSSGHTDVFEVTSDNAGLITINTSDYTFPEGSSFEIWAVLHGASITEREELTFVQNDATIPGLCVTFDAIAIANSSDGCNFKAEENLISIVDEATEQRKPCICVTQAMWDGAGGGKTLSGTYDEITAALIAGIDTETYSAVRITDFQTIYDQPDFDNAGTAKVAVVTKTSSVTEPLLIGLLNTHTLKPEAYSALYPKDQIRYDISFSQTEVMAAPAKGRITERIDHLNNRTDYDHRHVLFLRYESAPASGIFNQYKDNGGATQEFTTFQFAQEIIDGFPEGFSNNNYIGDYAILFSLYTNPFLLSNNVFGKIAEANQMPTYTVNNTFGETASSNYFLADVVNSIFGDQLASNTFNGIYDSIMGNDCINNSFFNGAFNTSIFGNQFSDNKGGLITSCVFGNNCGSNDFGFNINQCLFVDNAQNNDFINDINSVDFTLSTHVYAQYHCSIFRNAALVQRLSYIDAADTLTIVNPNS